MIRALGLTVLFILACCWLTRSAIDALANRVVDRIEQRVNERQRARHLQRRNQ